MGISYIFKRSVVAVFREENSILTGPMVFGISGVVDVQRRAIGQQELVARGR